MIINYLLMIAGFSLLIAGANWFVKGASGLAKKAGITELVIGLTIVAFGTSAPELIVNLFASTRGANEMVVGNILGSNIFNVLIILGITAMIRPVSVQVLSIKREIPISFLAGILILLLITNFNPYNSSGSYSRSDGILTLIIFVFYLFYLFRGQKNEKDLIISSPQKILSGFLIFLLIAGGLLSLILGGRIVVNNAVTIAEKAGMSQRIIGLTIVAAGTSLPELVTSAVAAARGNSDIALGNIIGSNIFNLMFILGLSGMIYPVAFEPDYLLDFGIYLFASLLIILFMFTGRRKIIDRWEGILFFAIYIIYILYILY